MFYLWLAPFTRTRHLATLRGGAQLRAERLDMQPIGYVSSASTDAAFKALADPVRRRLLDSLHARNGQTLGELCEGQDMTRQAVIDAGLRRLAARPLKPQEPARDWRGTTADG